MFSHKKELKSRYKSATFGFLWMLINPLLQMIVLTLVFSYFLKIDVPNYPLYAFSGLLPWMFFSLSIQQGTSSLINNRDILKKVPFPRELLPISAVLSHLIIFTGSLILLFIFSLFITGLNGYVFLLIPVMIVQTLFAIGISLLLSSFEIYYRDVSFVLQAFILLWFYISPILYPFSLVPEQFSILYRLNPMVGIITSYQGIFTHGSYFDVFSLVISFVATVIILLFGYVIFRARSIYFAEWI